MRVLPEENQARDERAAACGLLSAVLDRVMPQLVGDDTAPIELSPEALGYPGLFAAGYEAQAACRTEPSPAERHRLVSRLEDAVGQARASSLRAAASGCPAWEVDLAQPEEHLREGLARAVTQVPQRPDRAEALAAMRVAEWTDADRAAFCQAACLLADAWPAALAELRVVVRQVALLDGFGIDGFTDVATHGAVYVNRARLGADEGGVPGPVRLAEALVHEGAHNRCNAAALVEPFLDDPRSGSEPMVATPLRRDLRPLIGLLQQLVVLVRSLMLYDRLTTGSAAPAVGARREKLRNQAAEALRVIGAHTERLSDHGRRVVVEAGDLLAASATAGASASFGAGAAPLAAT